MKKLFSVFFLLFLFMGASAHAVGFPPNGAELRHTYVYYSSGSCGSTSIAAPSDYVLVTSYPSGVAVCGKTASGRYTPTYTYLPNYYRTGDYWMSTGSNNGCPANSSRAAGAQYCMPQSGFSAVNNNGTWSVVAAGSECGSGQVYDSVTGTCSAAPLPPVITDAAIGFAVAAGGALVTGLGILTGSLALAAGSLFAAIFGSIMSGYAVYASLDDVNSIPKTVAASGLNVDFRPVSTLPAPPVVPNLPSVKMKDTEAKYEVVPPASPSSGSPTVTTNPDGSKTVTGKDSNGVPRTIAEVSSDGTTATFYGTSSSGATQPVAQAKVYSDRSQNMSAARKTPTVNGSGGSTTRASAVTASYNSAGQKTSEQAQQDGTNSDGTPATGVQGSPSTTNGTGDCKLPDGSPCASEATLKRLADKYESGPDPVLNETPVVEGNQLASDLKAEVNETAISGYLTGLTEKFGIPSGGQCNLAVLSVPFLGQTMSLDMSEMCAAISPMVNFMVWILVLLFVWREVGALRGVGG